MDNVEYKTIPQYTKDVDGRTVIGIAAVFGNVDSYGDILHKGAFKKTITEAGRRVKHLWQHDMQAPPVAAIKALEEVGRGGLPDDVKKDFPEAKGGLQVTREYLNTERAEEVLEGIRAGAINEMSFGFNAVKFDYDTLEENDVQVRNLREVKLWDTSDVNWGANSATAASKSALDYKLMRVGDITNDILVEMKDVDDVFAHLQRKLGMVDRKQIITQLDELIKLLRAEPPVALTPAKEIARIEIAKRKLAIGVN